MVVGSVVVAYTIAHDLSDIFHCVPMESLWDPTVQARCINFNLQILILGIIGMITDIVIFAMPMGPVWRLKLPMARKWQLSALFLVGGLYVIRVSPHRSKYNAMNYCTLNSSYSVCIISIVRLFYISKFNSYDATCSSFPAPYGL